MKINKKETGFGPFFKKKLWAMVMVKSENTHLLRKGKYHCMADLFDWFGFSCFVELKL